MPEIPKVIHQIWSGVNEPLPLHFKQFGDTWKEYHPIWKYEFWDNQRINDFMQQFYPHYLNIYHGFKYNIQRWDAIRYLILYKIGGMYVDFDYECLDSLDNLLKDKSCCFSAEPDEHAQLFGKDIYFNNALMASVKEHPFLKTIIGEIFDYPNNENIYKDKIIEILETTGPLFLTNLYERYTDKNTVFIIPQDLVSPLSKMDVQKYLVNRSTEEFENYLEHKLKKAVAVHYFIGSWM